MPVGLHIVMDDFTPETVQLKKGDCVYLFSDGYQDQMGGPDGRKFMRKNLRELLVSIHQKHFAVQKEILNTNIEKWRHDPTLPNGEIDQMDDILVSRCILLTNITHPTSIDYALTAKMKHSPNRTTVGAC